MQNIQLSYQRLADHKGAKRLWLEGLRLAQAGYQVGARYRVAINDDRRELVLVLDADGERVVSRRKRGDKLYPVIDVNNQDIAKLFGDIERVRVVMRAGEISVAVHPLDEAKRERFSRAKERLCQGLALRTGSISLGLGVLDHAIHRGLEDTGIKTELSWAIECEPAYMQASFDNNPIWSSSTLAVLSRVEEVEQHFLSPVELLVAGLPCTGASNAGRAKNGLKFAEQHETAGTPFLAFLTIVRATGPAVIVFENVREYGTTVSMHMIRDVLTEWGYVVHETVLDGDETTLEDRKRLCMVAVTEGLTFNWNLMPTRKREARLGDVLEHVSLDSDAWKSCDYLHEKEQRDREAGKGFRMQLVDEESVRVGTIGRHYAKWRSTEPLIRHPTQPALKRLLTPREHARVKAVPEQLVEGLAPTIAHQCLGQSVLYPPFVAVGRQLGAHLRKTFLPPVA